MHGKSKDAKRIAGALLLAGALSLVASGAVHALVINATFVDGTGGGFDDASKQVVMNAIVFYESTFSDNVTVNIQFQNSNTGYGESSTGRYAIPYSTFQSALIADQTSADDATAIASRATDLF